MTIEATPTAPAPAVSGGRTASAPMRPENDTEPMAPKLGLRHRYLLQISDVATLTASAVLGAVTLSHISPVRAGNLGVRDVALAAVAMAVALHLHGLYRRPAVAAAAERVVATRGDRALPANGRPARTRRRRIHPPRWAR